ncbi:MAG: hypothetical protein NKF70_12765 [Methanobacterium sp. ERen5]|nr:MAG: hypothetical protein NKF70_12765 [Methanobacterium sp. ERen5]
MAIVDLGSTVTILVYFSLTAGLVNIYLLFLLLRTYWKTYNEIKSHFTIGLLYFASVMLIQNIFVTFGLVVHLFVELVPASFSSNLGPPFMLSIINIIQLVALTILYRISKN